MVCSCRDKKMCYAPSIQQIEHFSATINYLIKKKRSVLINSSIRPINQCRNLKAQLVDIKKM